MTQIKVYSRKLIMHQLKSVGLGRIVDLGVGRIMTKEMEICSGHQQMVVELLNTQRYLKSHTRQKAQKLQIMTFHSLSMISMSILLLMLLKLLAAIMRALPLMNIRILLHISSIVYLYQILKNMLQIKMEKQYILSRVIFLKMRRNPSVLPVLRLLLINL